MDKEDYKVMATEIMDVFRKHWVNQNLNNTGEAIAVLSLVCGSMFQARPVRSWRYRTTPNDTSWMNCPTWKVSRAYKNSSGHYQKY